MATTELLSDPKIEQDGVLICPRCGGTYLHQYEVSIIYREQEDGPGVVVDVDGGTASIKAVGVEDPRLRPTRRDYLDITFMCEECDSTKNYEDEPKPPSLVLRIVQHKGQTFLSWLSAAAEAASEKT